MSGITDLATLLGAMRPMLSDGEFVFCTLPGARYGAGAEYEPVACFAEAEGLTLVLARERAGAAQLPYVGVFRMLTLRVHSGLEAVGLTAAVAGCLAARGISANVLAAYYHDHVFIPAARAEEALEALQALSRTASTETPAA